MDKPKILIADDDIGFVAALQVRLENEGFEVITAGDSYRALVRARDEQPDLLLLDIHMPAGRGFSVQERLERLPRSRKNLSWKAPVIYVTGDKTERAQELAKELGAFALIHKPFDTEHLVDTILRAISPPPCAA